MRPSKRIKSERASIYFDSICAIIGSTIGILGLVFPALWGEIPINNFYFLWLGFWLGCLIFSVVFIIALLRIFYQETKSVHSKIETKKIKLDASEKVIKERELKTSDSWYPWLSQ